METRSLLIFDLAGALYALDAARVRESVWLPELTPVDEAPPWIVGLFSLRGEIVPVTDLHRRFGRPLRRYHPQDQVVVLDIDGLPMGLIVSEVREVVEIAAADIQPPPRFDVAAHLVLGEARVGDKLVALLDVSAFARSAEWALPGETVESPESGFCPEATPDERLLFHARARLLMQAAADTDGDHPGLAVVELGGECFGIELAAVREFRDIDRVSPIPCCPPHILGAISLRGELVVLLDARAALDLPPAGQPPGKAVVAWVGERAMALALDAVHDVVYPRRESLLPAPAQLRARHGARIKGTAPWRGGMMTVLDLPALLARTEWIVDEHV